MKFTNASLGLGQVLCRPMAGKHESFSPLYSPVLVSEELIFQFVSYLGLCFSSSLWLTAFSRPLLVSTPPKGKKIQVKTRRKPHVGIFRYSEAQLNFFFSIGSMCMPDTLPATGNPTTYSLRNTLDTSPVHEAGMMATASL